MGNEASCVAFNDGKGATLSTYSNLFGLSFMYRTRPEMKMNSPTQGKGAAYGSPSHNVVLCILESVIGLVVVEAGFGHLHTIF